MSYCTCTGGIWHKLILLSITLHYILYYVYRVGFAKLFAGCAASWFMGGKFHSARISKKLKTKFQREQKQLYTQYYNDVYKLSEQNAELQSYTDSLKDALKSTEAKHEMEAIQRDYDEFKQPDIDGDDRISRAEFNMYVKNYLSNYPGLTEADYPKFEDFDHDHDGYVSFQEYAQQMALQAQKAELDQMYGGTNAKEKAKGLNDLYESSVGSARTKMYR
jgi:Ca2+-binding EF-hand superfamily protein